MIRHHIDHQIHAVSVEGVRQIHQVFRRAEVRIQAVQIGLIIPVVTVRYIFRDRRDPDGIKAHVVDVVELVDDASPRASTVRFGCHIACCGGQIVGSRKSVREDLVY